MTKVLTVFYTYVSKTLLLLQLQEQSLMEANRALTLKVKMVLGPATDHKEIDLRVFL